MATNCCLVPMAMLGLAGVTAMDARVALVTVNVVVPEMPPDVAVIVVGLIWGFVLRAMNPEAYRNIGHMVNNG